MAGHSQFKNIMHKKGRADAKRAKMFTKVGREIQVAAKLGGGEPAFNPRLRTAIIAARAVDMPNDRIKKAIEAGTGGGSTADYFEMRYEGYGPGGVAIIVEALTDNKNRTAGDVRATFTKYGGNMGETGSVSFMFDHVGQIMYPAAKISSDAIFEAAVEAGADNVESDADFHEVITQTNDLAQVRDALEARFGEAEKSGFAFKPNVMAPLDADTGAALFKLIEMLEDNDDVQNVTTNFEISEEDMQKLAAAG